MSNVGERIREIREARGMTQDQLATKSGISKGFLSEVENDRRNVSSKILLKLAIELGATVDYLLTGTAAKTEAVMSIEIPVELSRVAEELHLTHSETMGILEAYSSIVARRNPQGARRYTESDWRELHKALEPFLQKR